MWALGEARFRITALGHEQRVIALPSPKQPIDTLAERLE
jgi:hypothetical protein